ncbi:MAG: right-handed parallel beta-helix repeat-containing protein [Christensenellaceae bacterium]|nr:right-handed parallel beta-helix repeat-containing protein [Christensenellaceae bacterium]
MFKKKLKVSHIILAAALVLSVAGMVIYGYRLVRSDRATEEAAPPAKTAYAAPEPSQPSPSPKPSEPALPSASPSAGPAAAPEDSGPTYVVENERFGIDNAGGNARATTDGINAALEWAKAEGYKTVAFQPGTYMIQCTWDNRFGAPTDGILVPSGITLDLAGATFVMEPNSNPQYALFAVVKQSDVVIKNGTLVGDRDLHAYAPSKDSPTHEYGFGICISDSNNVLIQDVVIKDMTGDGIIIEGSYFMRDNGDNVSRGIRIIGCNISNCRRQGISVVAAKDSEIANNEIYGISGTAPQYGIMMMLQLDYVIDNLKIHDNIIYDCAGGAIACNSGTGCEIYSNTVSGNILVVHASDIKIYDNTIQNSYIEVMPGASGITVTDNILEGNSWIKAAETPSG